MEGGKGVLRADGVDGVGAGECFFRDQEGVDVWVMCCWPIDVGECGCL